MSTNTTGEALYIFHLWNSIVFARANSFSSPIKVKEILSISTHDIKADQLSVLDTFRDGKKGFTEVHYIICTPSFKHLVYEPEAIVKTKASDAISDKIKEWMGAEEDFYFQVLYWDSGELVALDDPEQKLMLISGMKTEVLGEVQQHIIDHEFYPRRLECSLVLTIGLIRKMVANAILKGPVVLLEIYEDSGTIVIIPEEGQPIVREIDAGESSMYEQIRSELSLKDAKSAQKLLYSSTIDLSDIGRLVTSSIFKEVADAVGQYEVDTGQSIAQLLVTSLIPNHRWVAELLAKDLGMDLLNFDLSTVGELLGIEFEDSVEWDTKDTRVIPLLGAMEGF